MLYISLPANDFLANKMNIYLLMHSITYKTWNVSWSFPSFIIFITCFLLFRRKSKRFLKKTKCVVLMLLSFFTHTAVGLWDTKTWGSNAIFTTTQVLKLGHLTQDWHFYFIDCMNNPCKTSNVKTKHFWNSNITAVSFFYQYLCSDSGPIITNSWCAVTSCSKPDYFTLLATPKFSKNAKHVLPETWTLGKCV